MPFKPGNTVRGSRKGKPNKATVDAREAIARFVDGNTHRMQGWLEEIAEEHGPRAAFDCVLALLEYHVPKLNRTTIAGDAKNPIVPQWLINPPQPK